MLPSYIILTKTGERFNLNESTEFNPNEFEWHQGDSWIDATGLFWDDEHGERYCYRADYDERFTDPEDGPTTATTLAFRAYDSAGNMIFEDEGGNGFWL